MGHLALIITDMQDFINFINKHSAVGIVTTFNVKIIAMLLHCGLKSLPRDNRINSRVSFVSFDTMKNI